MALTNEDLQAISALLDQKINNFETKMDTKIDNLESKLVENMRTQINESSNMILRELDRVESRINQRFEKVDIDIQRLREDIHTTKYTNDTVNLLVKKVADLETRVSAIEHTA